VRLLSVPVSDSPPKVLFGDVPDGTPAPSAGADLDRRLAQVEHGLQHFDALLPAMAREVAAIRAALKRAA
jgi:hypothetical protein